MVIIHWHQQVFRTNIWLSYTGNSNWSRQKYRSGSAYTIAIRLFYTGSNNICTFWTNIWLSYTGSSNRFGPTYGYHTQAAATVLDQQMVIIHRQQQPFKTNIWLSYTGSTNRFGPTYGYHTQAAATVLDQHMVIIHRQQQPYIMHHV